MITHKKDWTSKVSYLRRELENQLGLKITGYNDEM